MVVAESLLPRYYYSMHHRSRAAYEPSDVDLDQPHQRRTGQPPRSRLQSLCALLVACAAALICWRLVAPLVEFELPSTSVSSVAWRVVRMHSAWLSARAHIGRRALPAGCADKVLFIGFHKTATGTINATFNKLLGYRTRHDFDWRLGDPHVLARADVFADGCHHDARALLATCPRAAFVYAMRPHTHIFNISTIYIHYIYPHGYHGTHFRRRAEIDRDPPKRSAHDVLKCHTHTRQVQHAQYSIVAQVSARRRHGRPAARRRRARAVPAARLGPWRPTVTS